METKKKVIKYPENLPLKQAVTNSGITIRHLSKLIGVSTLNISLTINGHYKGVNIKAKLTHILNQQAALGLGSTQTAPLGN